MSDSGVMQVVLNFTLVDVYLGDGSMCDDKSLNDIVFRTGIVLGNVNASGRVPNSEALYLNGFGVFNFPIIDPTQANRTGR